MIRPVPVPYAWAEGLTTVGVTGTNGKTSTTHLVAAALCDDVPALAVGTVGYFLGDTQLDEPRTGAGFISSLARLHREGGRFAAVECTSQALAQGYARRWRFDVGVFTNLSDDHVESHGSWEHYLAAKAQLFVHLGPGRTAVLNAADPASLALDAAMPQDVVRRYYAAPSRGPALRPPDLAAAEVCLDPSGTQVRLAAGVFADALGGEFEIRLVGSVFAENALAAALAAWAAGASPAKIRAGLRRCAPVPGRFEVLGRDPLVVVDYAHTPDALERTLAAARHLVPGRVLLVMGAGGERSHQKREPMGEAAGRGADVVWIANDNPRHEDPRAIADAVSVGVRRGGARYQVVLDRGEALAAALEEARSGDIVIAAGKGHEQTQQVGADLREWSDQEVLSRLLAGRSPDHAGKK